MDIDSAYMSLARELLEELVKPEKKEEFAATKHQWFPRNDTPENAAYDKRKPGLFTVEWGGDGFVGLNSKPTAVGARRARKPAAKVLARN